MSKELVEKQNNIIEYDAEGNATLAVNGDLHIVTNGDFLISSRGEVSVLSKTAVSFDCALLLLNCRLSKQLRRIKEELRMEFIELIGGMPDITPEQLEYVKYTKSKAKELLQLPDEELSHIKTE